MRKHPNSHRRLEATAPVLNSTPHYTSLRFPFAFLANRTAHRVRKSLEEEELFSEISETSYCHPAGANPA